jgi:hypothetical protein
LQYIGIGGRARIDGARIDGHATLEEGAVAGIAVGADQRQRAGAGSEAEIVQLIDGQAIRAGLRLTAGQQACRRQCTQPGQGLASCVIDVHRSLLSWSVSENPGDKKSRMGFLDSFRRQR